MYFNDIFATKYLLKSVKKNKNETASCLLKTKMKYGMSSFPLMTEKEECNGQKSSIK